MTLVHDTASAKCRLWFMPALRIPPAWLSEDMAHALAAMSPPLGAEDVVQAANELTLHAAPTRIIHNLLEQGADLMKVRMLVEALGALRDLPTA
jgi:hypothetical protein